MLRVKSKMNQYEVLPARACRRSLLPAIGNRAPLHAQLLGLRLLVGQRRSHAVPQPRQWQATQALLDVLYALLGAAPDPENAQATVLLSYD